MYSAFCALMRQKGWGQPGTRLVAGVSGGIDSMVLLYLLKELSQEEGFSLIAAHLNHLLRGSEADRDERFVRETCKEWGIPTIIDRRDVKKAAAVERLSIQVAARKVRYAFLYEVMKSQDGTYLVLGHHADDVAETVLLRLLRGASVEGLRGIPSQSGKVIRPLLTFRRKRIEAFAREKGIPFVEDSSNQSMKYARNRIRHELIPLIERYYYPSFSRRLVRYAAYFDEIQAYLSEKVEEAERDVLDERGSIKVSAFKKLSPALQRAFLEAYFIKQGWVDQPLTFEQLDETLKMMATPHGTRRISIGKGKWVVREYDSLFVTDRPSGDAIAPVVCPIPGSVGIPEIGNRLMVREVPEPPGIPVSNAQEAYVDGTRIRSSVWIRGFQPGDRIVDAGTKKLKKLFIDAKVPARYRRLIPLVGAGNDIIWVGGIRVDRRYYVSSATKRVLHLRFQFPIRVRGPWR